MADRRIINRMFIDEAGKHMTRCFDRHGMYIVPTDPDSIRPPMRCQLWKPPKVPTQNGWRSGVLGATAGFKAKKGD